MAPAKRVIHGEVLFVGPDKGGKTLLIKRLSALHSGGRTDAFVATGPTVGMQFDDVDMHGKTVRLRELGGQMGINWPRLLDSCHAIVYVIDTSTAASLAQASVELVELLNAKELTHKPLLVCLNKRDVNCSLSLHTINAVLRLPDLMKNNTLVQLAHTSGLLCDMQELNTWMYQALPALAEAIEEQRNAEQRGGKEGQGRTGKRQRHQPKGDEVRRFEA